MFHTLRAIPQVSRQCVRSMRTTGVAMDDMAKLQKIRCRQAELLSTEHLPTYNKRTTKDNIVFATANILVFGTFIYNIIEAYRLVVSS